jgi:hypothetical protein
MNYAFSLGCKKDEAREKTHQTGWLTHVRKHFSYQDGPTQSCNATLVMILVPTGMQRNTETLFATTTHRISTSPLVLYLVTMMERQTVR